jgi:hypothetical protein
MSKFSRLTATTKPIARMPEFLQAEKEFFFDGSKNLFFFEKTAFYLVPVYDGF